jgi:plastocyanin
VSVRSFVLVASALVLLAWLAGGAAAVPQKPASHTVVMEASRFEPETLTVHVGDKITWVNKDPFPHTATSAGTFDSTAIQPDQSWTFTAKTRGDLAYVCSFHPTIMKGTLRVQ